MQQPYQHHYPRLCNFHRYEAFSGTAYYNNENNWENDVLSIGQNLIAAKTSLSGEYTIKEGTKIIADGAFLDCDSLSSITIPNSVTSIGYLTFCDCRNLTSITIPDSVTSIGTGAFLGCEKLTSVTIGDSVTSIGEDAFADTAYYNSESNWENGVLYIGKYLIEADSSLSGEYIIKEGTRAIANEVFQYCYNLTNTIIPDSVTSIGESAFYGCDGLKSVVIPDPVTSIGDFAFRDCSSLTSITVDPDNSVYHSSGNCLIETESKTLIAGCKTSVIPTDGSVTSIAGSAFRDCENLTNIVIPDSVTSIGRSAFYGCRSLTTVYYTGSEAEWKQIGIGSSNYYLHNAEIVFNYTGE